MSESNGYATQEVLLNYVRQYKDVDLPNGVKVRIQTFNNKENEELQLRTMDESGRMNLRGAYQGFAALLIARAVVDGEGNRVFADADCDRIQEAMDPDIVELLREEIITHTKFGQSGIESQKKSLDASQDSSSPTS